MPAELRSCLDAGANTTLMVWADCDDNCADPDELKALFWNEAQQRKISRTDFDRVVFIFAKDRIENWIDFLLTGTIDESKEGPRVRHNKQAADAAKKLAEICVSGKHVDNMPASLLWSCNNWKSLRDRMK
jgi:hypothetical protein